MIIPFKKVSGESRSYLPGEGKEPPNKQKKSSFLPQEELFEREGKDGSTDQMEKISCREKFVKRGKLKEPTATTLEGRLSGKGKVNRRGRIWGRKPPPRTSSEVPPINTSSNGVP